MSESDILIVVVLWVVCAVGSYLIAAQRGDPSPGMWGFIGFLLGPIGLLLTGVMAKPRK
jgi:hypothetical protein